MKKSIVISILQLIFVACILATTVISFAWFSANQVVNTKNVVITAATSSDIAVYTPSNDEFTPYKGETGLGYEDPDNPDLIYDMPYRAIKKFYITCKPISTGYAFCVYFSQIFIKLYNGNIIDENNDPLITESFTFRLHLYDALGNIIETYGPDPSGFVVLISEDPEKNGNYLYINQETSFNCGFELIFLDEASYLNWTNKRYTDITEFRYDHYDYMRSIFNISFVAGMNIPT